MHLGIFCTSRTNVSFYQHILTVPVCVSLYVPWPVFLIVLPPSGSIILHPFSLLNWKTWLQILIQIQQKKKPHARIYEFSQNIQHSKTFCCCRIFWPELLFSDDPLESVFYFILCFFCHLIPTVFIYLFSCFFILSEISLMTLLEKSQIVSLFA